MITGGNSGIGLATATALAQRGAAVVITARDLSRGRAAASKIKADTGVSAIPMVLDLASLASVRSFTDALTARLGRIDVLVNNAGCYVTPRRETVDGFEWTMGVNHLGPFLLTCRLARDPATRPDRIVNVASDVHRSARRDLGFTSLEPQGRYRGTEAYAAVQARQHHLHKGVGPAAQRRGHRRILSSPRPGGNTNRPGRRQPSRIGDLEDVGPSHEDTRAGRYDRRLRGDGREYRAALRCVLRGRTTGRSGSHGSGCGRRHTTLEQQCGCHRVHHRSLTRGPKRLYRGGSMTDQGEVPPAEPTIPGRRSRRYGSGS